jgi:Zn-dependent protease with chaperone function
MKVSADTRKAISLILIYTALLFFLIGMAARMKSDFRGRTEVSRVGLTTAGVLAAAGVVVLALSRSKERS